VTLNGWRKCRRTANFPCMHKPHKLTKKHLPHDAAGDTAVVVEIEVLHHCLLVGLNAFRLPTTVCSTTEGLRERYRTSEDARMHATITYHRHWRHTITGQCETAHMPPCLENRSLARQATATQRPHYERCADYESRSAIYRSAANFSFRRYGQTCDETQVTDMDNQRIQTRTHLHFSCELCWAITVDIHTLQMWIIRRYKFVTSAHLCTPHACISARHGVTCHGRSGVSAVAYIGQIHAINAEFSTPSASRLDTVSAWRYSVDVWVSAPSAPQNPLTHRSRRCSHALFCGNQSALYREWATIDNDVQPLGPINWVSTNC